MITKKKINPKQLQMRLKVVTRLGCMIVAKEFKNWIEIYERNTRLLEET